MYFGCLAPKYREIWAKQKHWLSSSQCTGLEKLHLQNKILQTHNSMCGSETQLNVYHLSEHNKTTTKQMQNHINNKIEGLGILLTIGSLSLQIRKTATRRRLHSMC